MKNLLIKEFKLASHPAMYLFPLLSLLVLVPGYPYLIGPMYACLSIFLVFQFGRESRDVLFTAALPVRKSDAVRARCTMIVILELAQVLVAVIGCLVRPLLLGDLPNQAGMEANVAFIGICFGMFALYNIIYIPYFYKSAYKCGIAFLIAGIAVMLYIGAAETAVAVIPPVREFIETMEPAMLVKQIPVLVAGVLVFAAASWGACRLAVRNFEKVDL